jgi:predicted mannosyl-3-phosphoglycerate phosphatase (HAD superfamily)
MVANHVPAIHRCDCSVCRHHPRAAVAKEHRAINRLLAAADERLRRLLAGLLASKIGRGGIQQLARITGMHRNTVALGKRELRQKHRFPSNRVRRSGAGRKRLEEKRPGH